MLSSYDTEARGWLYVFLLYALCWFLHRVLPPFTPVDGYVCDCTSTLPLKYRFNGFYTLLVVVSSLYYLSTVDMFDPTDLARCYWPMFRAAFFLL